MTEGIIIAIITGSISAIVSIIGIMRTNSIHDAIIDEKIEELTREVRKHNDFAERIPVIENNVKTLYIKTDKLEEKIR